MFYLYISIDYVQGLRLVRLVEAGSTPRTTDSSSSIIHDVINTGLKDSALHPLCVLGGGGGVVIHHLLHLHPPPSPLCVG